MPKIILQVLILVNIVAYNTIALAQPETETGSAVLIMVDDSSSVITGAQASHAVRIRSSIAEAIVASLHDGDLVNVLHFADRVQTSFPAWTLVAGQRKILIRTLQQHANVGYWTKLDPALNAALAQFDLITQMPRAGRTVILISDGTFELTDALQQTLDLFRVRGIPISTVGIFAGAPSSALRLVAGLTGGGYVRQPTSASLKTIAEGLDATTRFPWAEVHDQLTLSLTGPQKVQEGSPLVVLAQVKLDGRSFVNDRSLTTPWGDVQLHINRVRLSVDKQPSGEMSRQADRKQFRFQLPSLTVGRHTLHIEAELTLNHLGSHKTLNLSSDPLTVIVASLPAVLLELDRTTVAVGAQVVVRLESPSDGTISSDTGGKLLVQDPKGQETAIALKANGTGLKATFIPTFVGVYQLAVKGLVGLRLENDLDTLEIRAVEPQIAWDTNSMTLVANAESDVVLQSAVLKNVNIKFTTDPPDAPVTVVPSKITVLPQDSQVHLKVESGNWKGFTLWNRLSRSTLTIKIMSIVEGDQLIDISPLTVTVRVPHNVPELYVPLALLVLITVPYATLRLRRRGQLRVGQAFTFSQNRVTIGAERDNDLVIDEIGVGQTHLAIQRTDDGYRIKDESGLGLEVNGNEVGLAELRNGDLFKFSHLSMEFTTVNQGFTLRVLATNE